MSDENSTPINPIRRFRFSLGSLLLLMAVVCLAISLAIVYSQLVRTERELEGLRPMSVEEVARQFENSTKFGNFATKVNDVRYSPTEDAFAVEFSWTDPATGTMWSTDTKLKPDGFGRYYGKIHSGEFLKAVGSTSEYYMIGVETPSPLKSK
jgi:hypothetical protein